MEFIKQHEACKLVKAVKKKVIFPTKILGVYEQFDIIHKGVVYDFDALWCEDGFVGTIKRRIVEVYEKPFIITYNSSTYRLTFFIEIKRLDNDDLPATTKRYRQYQFLCFEEPTYNIIAEATQAIVGNTIKIMIGGHNEKKEN